MVTGCVSSRLVHDCEGEAQCGFYGLPHVLCVPVPPYAQARKDGGEPVLIEVADDALTLRRPLHADS